MFNKKIFSEIIKKINDSYPTQYDFADIADVNRTYLSQAINCKLEKPLSPKLLKRIANASNGITTYEELMEICGYYSSDPSIMRKQQYYDLKERPCFFSKEELLKYPIDNVIFVPIYEKIVNNLDKLQTDVKEFFPFILQAPKNDYLFYLRITDNSMEKEFKEGDLVLCTETNNLKNGEIGVFIIKEKYNNEAIVRRYKEKDNIIILEPEANDKQYDIEIVKKDELKIIGNIISATKQY